MQGNQRNRIVNTEQAEYFVRDKNFNLLIELPACEYIEYFGSFVALCQNPFSQTCKATL